MRRENHESAPAPAAVLLHTRAQTAIDIQEAENLPGFESVLERDPKVKEWIDEQIRKMNAAIRDEDQVLLDRAVGSYIKACERVNEILAEEYRKANADPATWELRYIKWMSHVKYIKFESPKGVFYLVPRRPRQKPKAQHWYTADEMIDMMAPATREAIKIFDTMPLRPESLSSPGDGEKHMHIDFAGDRDERVTFDFKGGVNRDRKDVR